MDTWILVADDHHASLLVQSGVGSLHEIDSWDCRSDSIDGELGFACEIARGLESLERDFDGLVVAAPPALLLNLSKSFRNSLNAKVAAELARDLTHLSKRELRQELQELNPAGS